MPTPRWNTCYPRPQLRRRSFLPLNDGWTLNGLPIQLPFPPQAPCSGYSGKVGAVLRYEGSFSVPEGFLPGQHRLLLHFGAVDQTAEVSVNGVSVGRHEGGYLPFCFDITDALAGSRLAITVQVRDTLSRRYPYGKQCRRPHGMWYTPVSGIWQTVWLEAVPEADSIRALRLTPGLTGVQLEADTDAERITVTVAPPGETPVSVTMPRAGTLELAELGLTPRLWTPEEPYLYPITVETDTDRVESYFALRTFSCEKTGAYTRFCLNGKPVFLHGVLDQGYFADGLYLPASPEGYRNDILRMKSLGFNLLRKHIKLEPEIFYYECDRLGMLVLQDMVNSGGYSWLLDTALPNLGLQRRPDRLPGSRTRRDFFERHCRETQARLYNHPSVVGYTIFNEGWGQFCADRQYRACRANDPTRFYDATSGWFPQRESDTESLHVYFKNKTLTSTRPGQVLFLSECGGYTRPIAGHICSGKQYGYGAADTEEVLTERILTLYREMVLPSIPKGLCGCIYTQLSDVETEINGLCTSDRAVCKVEPGAMVRLAEELRRALASACARKPG